MINWRRHISLLVVSLTGLPAVAQTIIAEYVDQDGVADEAFAFDFDTGATMRINATGRILLLTPDGVGYEGVAGLAELRPSEMVSRETAPGMVLPAIPAAGLFQLEHFSGFEVVETDGPFGGLVYSGSFPLGDPSLGQLADFGNGYEFEHRSISYLLDDRGRLREIRNDNGVATHSFVPTDGQPPRHGVAPSLVDGARSLHDVRVVPNGDPSIFEPEAVAALAREMAFAQATVAREAERATAATASGRAHMQQVRDDQFGDSGIATRIALVATGFVLVAVGGFAWWKKR